MRWFGESWGAPICESVKHAATPHGALCAHECGHSIRPGDQGLLVPLAPMSMTTELAGYIVDVQGFPHLAYHLVCMFDEFGIRGVTHR